MAMNKWKKQSEKYNRRQQWELINEEGDWIASVYYCLYRDWRFSILPYKKHCLYISAQHFKTAKATKAAAEKVVALLDTLVND